MASQSHKGRVQMEVPVKAPPSYAKISKNSSYQTPSFLSPSRLQAKRCNRKVPPPPLGFKRKVHPEVVRWSQIDCEPSFLKQTHKEALLQAPNYQKSPTGSKPRGLAGKDRCGGCVFSRLDPPECTPLPRFPLERKLLAIQSSPVWSDYGSSSVLR